jgi:hypothetical protein
MPNSNRWLVFAALATAPVLVAGCASSSSDSETGPSGAAGQTQAGAAGSLLGSAGFGGTSAVGQAGTGYSDAGAAGSGVAGAGMAGASTGGTGASSAGASSAGASSAGASSAGASSAGASSAGATSHAGNPDGSCSAGIPTLGKPANIANPTTVVGTGTAASCTFSVLKTAVSAGGVISFNCGAAPVTISVTATLNLPTNKNTVIDGGNLITLDGGSAVEILRFDSANFRANDNGLTLQHLTLSNGKTTPKVAIPSAPPPCSQGFNDGEGGALYVRDGALTVIDAIFTNNQAAPLGPDTGGGAIYILGSKRGALIVGSTFTNNSASNAGAVGGLFSELDIYNSLFSGNKAIGHDANNDDASKCSAMNNGQNETGSGGNGGPIYSDGGSVNITLCGDKITGNSAGVNAFGGGLFFTSNDMMGTLSIADTTMTGNTGGSWTHVSSGSVTNIGTAVGVNAKTITVVNSMLQGYP